MLQKGCECREGKTEEWKQNWNEVFMDEVEGERGERKRGEKKRGERKKLNVIKCLETEKDERFKTVLQVSFYVLKIKSKFKKFRIIKICRKY
jgi:hypothetical protein